MGKNANQGYLLARLFQSSHSGLPEWILNVTASCWRCIIGFFSALCMHVCLHSYVSRVWSATVAVSAYLTCFSMLLVTNDKERPCMFLGLSSSIGKREKKVKYSPDSYWWGFTRVMRFTGSHNGWGGKGALEVSWSKAPAQARSPRAGCPGCVVAAFEYLPGETLYLDCSFLFAKSPVMAAS